jgi:signal transduction histidine kinase
VASRLIGRIMVDVRRNLDFSFFDLTIEGTPYQVVSHVFRSSSTGAAAPEPVGVLGFLVNMEWARTHYFLELVQQVERVVGADTGLALGVLDAGGEPVVRAQPHTHGPVRRRAFSLTFFDPLLAAVDPSTDLSVESWRVEVTAGNYPALRAANQGARQTLIIATVAAVVLALGLIETTRAAREHARLAQMRSDFVSAVTHELKTPIAAIRALGQTLISGRLPDAARSREYAELVVEEAKRLTRLVDNLLAYAQITDTTQAYAFAPLAVEDLVRQSLGEYARKLEGFDVRVGLPADLPLVRADRTAIGLMLDNLLDNAIRYSAGARRIRIGARHAGRTLTLEITDKGIGIPTSEVGRVTRKGFRGRDSELGGSGLGLAIVQRIVDDHGGRLAITSATGKGTSIFVTLPVADDDHDETHSPG